MNNTNIPRSVQLGTSAYALAREFEAEQLTPEKGRRVYLNTLAVYAVYTYLRWLQINVDLSLGDSWNLRARTLFDVADLVLTDVGKLECRPVLPGETKIYLPSEVTENRIGYIAVEIDESEGQALLLGFSRTIELNEEEEIQLDYFQPIDTLLDVIPEEIEEESVITTPSVPVNLSQWLSNTFESSWQTFEEIFSAANQLSGSVRSASVAQDDLPENAVRRAKLVNLDIQMGERLLALMVTITPIDEQMDIIVQILPSGGRFILPQNLQMTFLDEAGAIIWEGKTGVAEHSMQQGLVGKIGDSFSVKLTLGNVSITEYFVI